jgi:hypothetical protein
MEKAMFAAMSISWTTIEIVSGSPPPPYRSSSETAPQPAAVNFA